VKVVALLMGFLWRIDVGPRAAAQAERMLDLVIAGLRSDGRRAPSADDRPGTALCGHDRNEFSKSSVTDVDPSAARSTHG
jgi:hypothetical protein